MQIALNKTSNLNSIRKLRERERERGGKNKSLTWLYNMTLCTCTYALLFCSKIDLLCLVVCVENILSISAYLVHFSLTQTQTQTVKQQQQQQGATNTTTAAAAAAATDAHKMQTSLKSDEHQSEKFLSLSLEKLSKFVCAVCHLLYHPPVEFAHNDEW